MRDFLIKLWHKGLFLLVVFVGISLASVVVHATDEEYTTDDFTLVMEGGTKYVPSGTGVVNGNFTFKKSKLLVKEFNFSGSSLNSVINLAYKGAGSGGISEILVEETNAVVDTTYQTAYTWVNHGNGTIEPTSPTSVNATKITSYVKTMKPLNQAKLQFKDNVSIPIRLVVKDLQKDKEINWTANFTFTFGGKTYSFKIDPMFNTTTTNRVCFSTNTTGLSASVYNITCPINGTSGSSFGGSVVSNIWGMCQSINGTSCIYYSSGGTDINEVNGSDNERFSTKTEWGVAQNFTIGASFFPSYVNDSTYFRKSGANLVSEFSGDTCTPVSGTPVQIENYPSLIGFSINQTNSSNAGFLCDNNDFSVTGSNFYFETIFMPTNLGAHGNGKRLLHKWSSTDSYWFGISGSGSAKILGANLVIGSSGITIETTEDLNNYEVYHVIATFDGITLRLFVNGILNKTAAYGTVKSMPFVSGVSCVGTDILDGSSCNSGNWLPAQLGELEVGEKNLSQDEITVRYRSKMQSSFWTWGVEESTAGGATNKEPNSTVASITSVLYKNTTANFSSLYTDDDLHIGILNFRIWRNSVYLENISRYDIPNGTNISISYNLATSFSHFDNLTVETYANDNTTNSSYKNSSVFQLRDVMPSATLSWTPASISSGSTLNISSLYNDFDTDNATIRFYIYKNAVETVNINRTSVANNTNVSVTSSPSMVNGDNISYLINASSLAESVKLSSTNITVGNTAPVVNAASLSAIVYKNSSLNASTVCTDADSNNCAVTFRLWLNSAYQTSITGTSMASGVNTSILFTLASYSHFDNITIEAYGDDNNINSTYVNSTAVQIQDILPRGIFSYSPPTLYSGNISNLSVLYLDEDLDLGTLRFYAYKNAIEIANTNKTSVANNTNMSVTFSLYFVPADNISYLVNVSSLGSSVISQTSNLTVSGTNISAIFVSPTDNNASSISNRNFTYINVTISSEGIIDTVNLTWNGTMATLDSSSLVLSMFFDENSTVSGGIKDSSRYGNNGTATGIQYTNSGKFGSAWTFNKTLPDSYITVLDSTSLNFGTGDFTILAWMKADTFTDTRNIITKDDGTGTGFGLRINGTGLLTGTVGGSGTISVGTDLDDGIWHHVVLIRNNGTFKVYSDGVERISAAGSGNVNVANNLMIGSTSSPDKFFNGTIDDVKIYNKALTPLEVNLSMQLDFGKRGTSYFANVSNNVNGVYTYFVHANNTDGTSNVSATRTLTFSQNFVPTINTPSLTAVLYKNSTLNTSVVCTDTDGDQCNTTFRLWLNSVYQISKNVNGLPSGGNSSVLFPMANYSHSDNITIEAYGDDSKDNSIYVNSSVIRISDVPPTTTLSWTPGVILLGSTLNISSLYNDFDTDNATIRVYIYKNAVETVSINRTSVANNTNISVTSSPSMVNGDNISYIINASSLAESVQTTSLNITVGNTAPTINSASLSSIVYKNSSLNTSAVCTDVDNSNCVVTFRLWLNAVYQTSITGTSIASGANTSILFVLAPYSHFDNVTIEAYGNDNSINSTYVNSSAIKIQDVVPSATLSWTPGAISVGDTLNISSLYNDFDTDNATVRFYIYKNGIQSVSINRTGQVNGTNVSVISNLALNGLDKISYIVEAQSLASIVTITTSNFTVQNREANSTLASITPITLYRNITANFSSIYTDDDLHIGILNFRIWRNGIYLENISRYDLPNNTNVSITYALSSNFKHGDTVLVETYSDDNTTNSSYKNSTLFTIQDIIPTMGNSALLPITFYKNITANISSLYNDEDGHLGIVNFRIWRNDIFLENISRSNVGNGTNVSITYYLYPTFNHTDTFKVEVYGNDNLTNSTYINATLFTIQDILPTITAPSITPITFYKNITANVSVLVFDLDEDKMNVTFRIWKNGTFLENITRGDISNNTNVSILYALSASFKQGDTILFEAYGNDNLANSTYVNSTLFTIQNIIPTINSASLQPVTFYNNITANLSAKYNDEDSHIGILNFRIWRNDVYIENVSRYLIPNGTNVSITYVLASTFNHTDTFKVEVYADDNLTNSSYINSTTFTIQNIIPSTTQASITSSVLYKNSTANISTVYIDLDTDKANVTFRIWRNGIFVENITRAGVANNTNVSILYVLTPLFNHTDNFSVETYSDDIFDNSSYINSSTIQLRDIFPTTTLSWAPGVIREGNVLNISSLYNDFDNDAATIRFYIFRNGIQTVSLNRTSIVNGTNVSVVSSPTMVGGDNISYVVNATSLAESVQVANSNITVSNYAPVVNAASLLSAVLYKNSTLNSSVVCTDADGDQCNVTIRLWLNSAYQTSLNVLGQPSGGNSSVTFLLSTYSHFDNLTVEAYGDDSWLNSTYVNSSIIQMSDIFPSLTAISREPATLYIGSQINVSTVYNDFDTDNATITITIFRNGLNVNITTRNGIVNGTNTSIMLGITISHFDNISILINATSLASSVIRELSNFTVLDFVPSITALSRTPATVYKSSSINISTLYRDNDTDNGTFRIEFYENGIQIESVNRTSIQNNTNVSVLSSFSKDYLDNISVIVNVTSLAESAQQTLANFTVASSSPQIGNVTVIVRNLGGNNEVVVLINATDTDGGVYREACFIGSVITRTFSGDYCELNVSDSLTYNDLIWVNDSTNLNASFVFNITITNNTYKNLSNVASNLTNQSIQKNDTFANYGNESVWFEINHTIPSGGITVQGTNITSIATGNINVSVYSNWTGDFILEVVGNITQDTSITSQTNVSAYITQPINATLNWFVNFTDVNMSTVCRQTSEDWVQNYSLINITTAGIASLPIGCNKNVLTHTNQSIVMLINDTVEVDQNFTFSVNFTANNTQLNISFNDVLSNLVTDAWINLTPTNQTYNMSANSTYTKNVNITRTLVVSRNATALECVGEDNYVTRCEKSVVIFPTTLRYTITTFLLVLDDNAKNYPIRYRTSVTWYPSWSARKIGSELAVSNISSLNTTVSSDELYVYVTIGANHSAAQSLIPGNYSVAVTYDRVLETGIGGGAGGGGGGGDLCGDYVCGYSESVVSCPRDCNVTSVTTPATVLISPERYRIPLDFGKEVMREIVLLNPDINAKNVTLTVSDSGDGSAKWIIFKEGNFALTDYVVEVPAGNTKVSGKKVVEIVFRIPVNVKSKTYSASIGVWTQKTKVNNLPIEFVAEFSVMSFLFDPLVPFPKGGGITVGLILFAAGGAVTMFTLMKGYKWSKK